MSTLLILLRFLATLLAIVGGLFAAGAALASVAGAWSDRLDAFAHFAPLWFVGGGLALLLGWVGGSRIGIGLGAIAVMASGILIVPELWAGVQLGRRVARPDLTVVQFNLWAANPQQARTARWILAQNADVIVLEEAYGGVEPIIRQLRARYPYATTCRRSPCSAMILSRRAPVRTGDTQRLPGVRTHLSGAWATFNTAQGPVTVFGVHFGWPWPFGNQRAQRNILVQSLRGLPHDRLILAGDFNAAPWSYSLRRLDRNLGLQRYSRAMPSWPAQPGTAGPLVLPFPIMPIDHAYAGPGWSEVEVRRGPRLGSDHYPLVMRLRARRSP